MLIAIICVVSVVCVTLFASCGISDPEIFTLSFDLNGGVSEEIRNVKVGQIVSENTNVYMIDYTEETPNIILTDFPVKSKHLLNFCQIN